MQWTLICLAMGVLLFTTAALVSDLRTRKIPNWLTVGSFALALLFHGVTAGLTGLGTSLAGFAVGFGLLFVLWLIGGGGGGDVKLMGALGAWLGAPLTLIVFVLSVVLAVLGLIGIFVWKFATNSANQESNRNNEADEEYTETVEKKQLGTARRLIPYALPVAVASWAVMILKLIAGHVGS